MRCSLLPCKAALLILTLTYQVVTCHGHGLLIFPPQRGFLGPNIFYNNPPTIPDLPRSAIDWYPHFPAGEKYAQGQTVGLKYQIEQAKPEGWTPYEPTKPGFKFRAGVCGDRKDKPEHMRGGIFYYPSDKPHIVAEFQQGGVLDASVGVIGHHNGYVEFTLCDVAKCGGEISEECLRNGNTCRKLERLRQEECEAGDNPNCGPIDRLHKTRWYLPCNQSQHNWYGRGFMKYQLPSDIHCDHCVLQWYWVAANSCNPPGILQYFRGPDGPRWGDCPGEGDAIGGYRPWGVCGGSTHTEEYYTCADIRINQSVQPQAEAQSDSNVESLPEGYNPVQELLVYVNGNSTPVKNGERKWIRAENQQVSLEAFTGNETPKTVWFHVSIQGSANPILWKETSKPYVFNGNVKDQYNTWKNPILKKWFTVSITSEDNTGRTYFFKCDIYLG